MITTRLSLLEGLRAGNPRVWQEFVRLYGPPLMAFSRRFGLCDTDASDAIQETLIAVYTTFRGLTEPFDRSKGRFKSWLRGIAKNKVCDIRRRRAQLERVASPEAIEETAGCSDSSAMDEGFELDWQRSRLKRARDQVAREFDPSVIQAFELYVLQEQSPEKVAKLLGTTRNAVYISKTRVLKRLRAVVAALVAEEG